MPTYDQPLPNETPKAFDAFIKYRDMGPQRSLAKLGAALDKNTSYIRQLQKWSGEFSWQNRIREYMAAVQAEAEQQSEQKRLRARKKRSSYLRKMETLLTRSIEILNEQYDAYHDPDSAGVNVRFVATTTKLFDTVMEQSRKEHNDLPTEKTDVTSKGESVTTINFSYVPPREETDGQK